MLPRSSSPDLAVNASKTGKNRFGGSYWNSISPISQSLHISAAQRTIRNRESSVKGAECRLDSNHGGHEEMTDLDRQKSAGKSERRKQKRSKKAEKQQSPAVAEAASAPIDAPASAEAAAAPAEPVETTAALDTAPADPVETAAAMDTGPAEPVERVASFKERMASVMPPADTAPAKPAAPAVTAPAEQAAPPAPAQAVASPAAVPPPAAVPSPAVAPAASIQAIANAYRDYTKKSLEDAQTFAEKLSAARSIDKAVEAQTEFARQACETFADNSRKIRELHRELFWQTFRLPNWPPGRTQR
jgi:hypothetical protein